MVITAPSRRLRSGRGARITRAAQGYDRSVIVEAALLYVGKKVLDAVAGDLIDAGETRFALGDDSARMGAARSSPDPSVRPSTYVEGDDFKRWTAFETS